MHGHRPSAAAARDVAEGGEGGRPHRCFPLPPGMSLRTISTARAQVRSRRPREAPTCRGARTAHVESAPRGLRRGRKPAGGGNSAHARTYRQSQPLPLAVLGPPAIFVAPESILRHGTTHAVSVRPDA